jgi:hypothetical protein
MSVGGMISASIWPSYRALAVCLCFDGRKNRSLTLFRKACDLLRLLFSMSLFNSFSLAFVIEMRPLIVLLCLSLRLGPLEKRLTHMPFTHTFTGSNPVRVTK